MDEPSLIYLSLLALFLIILIVIIRKFRNKFITLFKDDYKQINRWINYCVIVLFVSSLVNILPRLGLFGREIDNFIIRPLMNIPFQVFLSIFPVVIAILISKKLGFFKSSSNPSGAYNEKDSELKFKEIMESEGFLTTLRTSLPSGKKDNELGLDYVPFMLHNIEERKNKYTALSDKYLNYTFISIIIFSSILMYFGYILVNDNSVGVGKQLQVIETQLKEININLEITPNELSPLILENNNLSSGIQRLGSRLYLQGELSEDISNLGNGFFAVYNIKDLRRFIDGIEKLDLNKNGMSEENVGSYQTSIERLLLDSKKTINNYDNLMASLKGSISNLESFSKTLDAKIEGKEYRNSELLRRLSIGIIVSSFFLALVRYISLIYKANHTEMLKAESEELIIRKFYVAYRTSNEIIPLRQQSITSLFGENNSVPPKGANSKISQHEAGIIKDLISTLSKKI